LSQGAPTPVVLVTKSLPHRCGIIAASLEACRLESLLGERSAVIYTLLGSCRRHGINPFDYLNDLFNRLPAPKITQINEVTPMARGVAKRSVGSSGCL